MASIPINPAMIANAAVYTAPLRAVPINLCKSPKEGFKSIAMQFTFTAHTGFLVQFPNSPNAPMSQLCALYIDASQSNFDVNIYFPDTGYTVRIEQGACRMIPVITGATAGSLPVFYVLLDSNNVTNNSLINIQALNQFVPEFVSHQMQNTLAYGYSNLFELQPSFTQSTNFVGAFGLPIGAFPLTIIGAQQWFITGINANIHIKCNVLTEFALSLNDGATELFQWSFFGDTTLLYITLADLSGINILSFGNGACTLNLQGTTANITNVVCTVNTMGGILVP